MPSFEKQKLLNALSEEEVLQAAKQELGEDPRQMEVSVYLLLARQQPGEDPIQMEVSVYVLYVPGISCMRTQEDGGH